jgi:hypothetical protein
MGGLGTLASTGLTQTHVGFTFEPLAMVGAAVLLVAVVATALRLGWRRNKVLNSR